MGRHAIALTPEQIAEVETLASVLSAAQIADYFGIGRTTFFAMVRNNEAIAERYKKGKARAIGAIAQSLLTKARAGDTTSMIFYLKTQAGWRETLKVEHGEEEWHEDSIDLTKVSDADLMRMIGVLDNAMALDEPGPVVDIEKQQECE